MIYRDDIEALEVRHAALQEEVAERTRARDEVAIMLAEARARHEAARHLADLAVNGPARRRRRRILAALAVSVLALAGIGAYRAAQPGPDRIEEAIGKFSGFVDELCRCTDTACTERVNDAMNRWGQSMKHDAPPKLSDEQMKRVTEMATRMSRCMMKARGELETVHDEPQPGPVDPEPAPPDLERARP